MDALHIGVLVGGALLAAHGGLCMFAVDREAQEPETDEEWRQRKMRDGRVASLPRWRQFLLLLVEPITGAALLVFTVAAVGGFELARWCVSEGELDAIAGLGAGGVAASLYVRYLRGLRRAVTDAADLRAKLKVTEARLQEEHAARIEIETRPQREKAEAERRELEEKRADEERKREEERERARAEGRIVRFTS